MWLGLTHLIFLTKEDKMAFKKKEVKEVEVKEETPVGPNVISKSIHVKIEE